jgi:hypothetical protein
LSDDTTISTPAITDPSGPGTGTAIEQATSVISSSVVASPSLRTRASWRSSCSRWVTV